MKYNNGIHTPCNLFLAETPVDTWQPEAGSLGCPSCHHSAGDPRRLQDTYGRVELHCGELSCGSADLYSTVALLARLCTSCCKACKAIWTNGIMDLGFYVALHCIIPIVCGNKIDFRKPKVNLLQFFFLHITANKKLCQSEISSNLQGHCFNIPFCSVVAVDTTSCIWPTLIQPFVCFTGKVS